MAHLAKKVGYDYRLVRRSLQMFFLLNLSLATAKPLTTETSGYGSFLQSKDPTSQTCTLSLKATNGQVYPLLALKNCEAIDATESMGALQLPATAGGVELHVFTMSTDESEMRCEGMDTIVVGLSQGSRWAVRAGEACTQPSVAFLHEDGALILDVPASTTQEGTRFEVRAGHVTQKVIPTLASRVVSSRTVSATGVLETTLRLEDHQEHLVITTTNAEYVVDHPGGCGRVEQPTPAIVVLRVDTFDDKRTEITCISVATP